MRRALLVPLVLLLACFSSVAWGHVSLKSKVIEGARHTHEISQLTTQVLTINGQDFKTESDVGITLVIANGTKNGEGKIPQRIKYEVLRSNLSVPGNLTLNYDSSINLAKTDSEQLQFVLDAMRALTGAEFTLLVDAENNFHGVEGTEAILKQATDRAADLLKVELGEEKLRREHEQSLARLPKEPVKLGDTWDKVEDVDLGAGQILKVERRYEYAGVEERGGRTLDKISCPDKKVVSLEAMKNNLIPFTVSKTELEIADSKATILFDRERGIVVEASRLMHVKGKLTLSINDMDLPTMLDLKIESKDVVKE